MGFRSAALLALLHSHRALGGLCGASCSPGDSNSCSGDGGCSRCLWRPHGNVCVDGTCNSSCGGDGDCADPCPACVALDSKHPDSRVCHKRQVGCGGQCEDDGDCLGCSSPGCNPCFACVAGKCGAPCGNLCYLDSDCGNSTCAVCSGGRCVFGTSPPTPAPTPMPPPPPPPPGPRCGLPCRSAADCLANASDSCTNCVDGDLGTVCGSVCGENCADDSDCASDSCPSCVSQGAGLAKVCHQRQKSCGLPCRQDMDCQGCTQPGCDTCTSCSGHRCVAPCFGRCYSDEECGMYGCLTCVNWTTGEGRCAPPPPHTPAPVAKTPQPSPTPASPSPVRPAPTPVPSPVPVCSSGRMLASCTTEPSKPLCEGNYIDNGDGLGRLCSWVSSSLFSGCITGDHFCRLFPVPPPPPFPPPPSPPPPPPSPPPPAVVPPASPTASPTGGSSPTISHGVTWIIAGASVVGVALLAGSAVAVTVARRWRQWPAGIGAGAGRYERLGLLGQGAHGLVSLARRRADGVNVAIKHVACHCHRDLAVALQEIDALTRIPAHPNLIRVIESFHGTLRADLAFDAPAPAAAKKSRIGAGLFGTDGFEAPLYVSLVMDYHSEGTLHALLESRAEQGLPLPASTVVSYTEQLASLLAHIHGQDPPLIHRDLKPENVLIADSGTRIVVSDFGIARSLESTYLSTQTGTLPYVAPECWDRRYGTAADMWALGCMMYVMMSLRVSPARVRIMFNETRRPGFPSFLTDEPEVASFGVAVGRLMSDLLCVEPRVRLSADQVLRRLRKPESEGSGGGTGSGSGKTDGQMGCTPSSSCDWGFMGSEPEVLGSLGSPSDITPLIQ
eukprot:TRINITY_DN3755_c3_g2_i1.p1 TRINITY_DN3755_c3_g2~~TRINITY_DN3755_c3_g2_i1.p1  ORF type:complete len:840 (+),score=149.17 TRINITY_DN3755_c3_g2_i1:86-2605(+)